MRKRIYLDYAATTPLDPKVLKAMLPYLKKEYGNPSSSHSFGQAAKAAIEKAREQVAKFLSCNPLEVVFTSGATEANNLAIQGIIKPKSQNSKPHIITSQIEHESVLSPCQALEQEGVAEVTYVPVDKEGIVRVEDIEKAIKPNTALVSVMHANSEIGTIQPIAEIGALLKVISQKLKVKILFHTDAVQAAQFLPCDVQKLGVDMLTLSAHKFYGPKGTGGLFVREGGRLDPLFLGGGQEQGLRSGTENVAGIVGMGEAVEEIHPVTIRNIKIRQLRDQLIRGVLRNIPRGSLTGSLQARLPNNAHFCFEGIQGQELLMALNENGIAVSTGSACSEKTNEPSHVLLALGMAASNAMSCIRVTLGKQTTKEEIERTVKTLRAVLEKLRRPRI
ncbi:MAG: cysteine desulfurase [Parcubacteria group bacterium Greene0714_21]|nr:MAG: cysteine desulfurase [Parcubacteria group bacterium Greene0416_39]TSD04178.1 MAG: cysteine desulfurase [Parcubacteria group bacterium Greene0714_21]